ncbi:MAG: hypothetical protein ABR576_12425 [Thermoanaerobaculia bacterium]
MSEKGPARAGAVLAATAVLVAAILAYEAGRHGPPPASPGHPEAESAPTLAADAPVARVDPTPSPEVAPPAGFEASAVFVKPIPPLERSEPAPPRGAPAPEPPPEVAPQGERRDAARCLRLDVTPTYVEAHRAAGPMVQLTVRAQNDCAFAFEGRQVAFRISATSPDGFELAHAVARFGNDLPAYGTAQTTVDLLCDATRVARYRVDLL